MKLDALNRSTQLCLFLIAISMLAFSACSRSETTTNANITNVNATPTNANANLSTTSLSVIVAREPETYKATMVISAITEGGEKTVGIPTLSAEVARRGADRRLSFKLPDGSDLIYIETGGKHLVLAPGRKQYAELTPEATGFQLQKLMTPGQIVSHLEKLKGVERVGEETINGRLAEKYRYANTTNTSTAAGQVNTEAFVFVDKETGLPLKSELYSESSGNVQGVNAAKIVAELRDISTTVDDALFQVPADLKQVPPEQVRAQIDAITNTVAAVIKALLSNMASTQTGSATPTTTASPSSTASPRPSL
jgi:hypothetical protein